MKKAILIFLFSLSVYAQNDSIIGLEPKLSVVSADKLNIVYRGVPNPISIAVNDAKGFKVSGNGISIDEKGKYILRPGTGKETSVIIEIEKFDGSVIVEEKVFRIKGLPIVIGTLNDENCLNCLILLKRVDIEKSIISTRMYEFLMIDLESDFFKVNSFEIEFSNGKIIQVEGNIFNKESQNAIKTLKKGEIFTIQSIKYGPPTCGIKRRVLPIKIIMED